MAGADHSVTGEATRQSTAALLTTATDQLERALERVDLENEPQLADRVIEAVEATDKAAELATEDALPE